MATAEPAARRHDLHLVRDPGLREVRRPAGRVDDFANLVRDYLESGEAPAGWEPRVEAAERIGGCLARALATYAGTTLAAVSHGTVLTLFLMDRLGMSEGYELWRAMPFASHARVDPDTPALVTPFG